MLTKSSTTKAIEPIPFMYAAPCIESSSKLNTGHTIIDLYIYMYREIVLMNTFWTPTLSAFVLISRFSAWIPNPFLLQPKGLPSGPQGKQEIDDCGYGSKVGYHRNLQKCDHLLIFQSSNFLGAGILNTSRIKLFLNILDQWFCWMICLLIWVTSLGTFARWPNQSKGRNVSISRLAWHSKVIRWSWPTS